MFEAPPPPPNLPALVERAPERELATSTAPAPAPVPQSIPVLVYARRALLITDPVGRRQVNKGRGYLYKRNQRERRRDRRRGGR